MSNTEKHIQLKGLKAARMQALLSQVELADKLGVHLSTVNRWEKGRGFISPENLFKLCEELGRSETFLIHGPQDLPKAAGGE